MDVALPGTTFMDGQRVDAARLRPIDGHAEVVVEQRAVEGNALAVAAVVLAHCVLQLRVGGAWREAAPDLDRLTVGDREALLLRIAEASFGPRLDLVASCPAPACGETLDLEVSVADLCLGPAEDAQEVYTAPAADGSIVRFRLPTSADLEAIGGLAGQDPRAAADVLARRCLVAPDLLAASHPDVAAAIDGALAGLDPQADIELTMACPACGSTVTATFDAGEHLAAELVRRRADRDVSVHLLASQYHWSETQILDLPIARRRRYAELMAAALGEAG